MELRRNRFAEKEVRRLESTLLVALKMIFCHTNEVPIFAIQFYVLNSFCSRLGGMNLHRILCAVRANPSHVHRERETPSEAKKKRNSKHVWEMLNWWFGIAFPLPTPHTLWLATVVMHLWFCVPWPLGWKFMHSNCNLSIYFIGLLHISSEVRLDFKAY